MGQRTPKVPARKLEFEPTWNDLDPDIRHEVRILWENGIETFESCQGTEGHCYREPTVRFFGGQGEGFRALAIGLANGLHVYELHRLWQIIDGAPSGPYWEMTFHPSYAEAQRRAEKIADATQWPPRHRRSSRA